MKRAAASSLLKSCSSDAHFSSTIPDFLFASCSPLPLLDQAGLPHLMQLRIRGLCFCATLLQSQKCLTSFHSSWWLVEAVVNIAINGNIKFLPVERMPSSWVAKGPPGVRLMMGEPTLLSLSCHCSCLLSQAAERVEDHAGFQ